jgi:hypothetical protein
MSDDFDPLPTTTSIPAADMLGVVNNKPITMKQSFPIKQPSNYKDEVMLYVFASSITRCRRKLLQIKDSKYPSAEILLAIACASIGATASATTSAVPLNSGRGIFFYIVLTIIAAASLTAYFMYRTMSIINTS